MPKYLILYTKLSQSSLLSNRLGKVANRKAGEERLDAARRDSRCSYSSASGTSRLLHDWYQSGSEDLLCFNNELVIVLTLTPALKMSSANLDDDPLALVSDLR